MEIDLTTFLKEKNFNLSKEIEIDGVFGFTYQDLIDEIETSNEKKKIKKILIKMDFCDVDITKFLCDLAKSLFINN